MSGDLTYTQMQALDWIRSVAREPDGWCQPSGIMRDTIYSLEQKGLVQSCVRPVGFGPIEMPVLTRAALAAGVNNDPELWVRCVSWATADHEED